MSAWIVEKGHIDVLVTAALQYGVLTGKHEDPRLVGQRLWLENHISVNHRYSENESVPPYRLPRATRTTLHPVAALKALACYDYQSCEHAGWDASDAKAFCARLEAAILARHPDLAVPVPSAHYARSEGRTVPAYEQHAVYREAPWGFTRLDQAYASAFAVAAR